MPKQRLLPGFDPPPKPTDRLFFAVLPDHAAVAEITQSVRSLRAEYGLLAEPIIPGRLHVSLLGLGDYDGVPTNLVTHMSRAALNVVLPTFDASFDRALSFSGRSNASRNKAIVLKASAGVTGFMELHHKLVVALQNMGLRMKSISSFTPHMTLLYDTKTVSEHAIAPVRWIVNEFVLVHSSIGLNQPYTLLGRWPLI